MSRKRQLSTRIVTSQVAILLVTMAIGFRLYTHVGRQQLDRQYEIRALAVAQSVAAMPEIRNALSSTGPSSVVQALASQVEHATGATFVVVIDRNGVRLSHPNPALVGQKITEPVVALDGRGHVRFDPGSLGRSANGRAPVFGSNGTSIGEVSVGFLDRQVATEAGRQLPVVALYTGLALLTGVLASLLLARRLKRITFGLELEEIAELLREREATLHGIREGVVVLDPAGKVKLVNDEARSLLGLGTTALGEKVDRLLPPGRLRDLLSGIENASDEVVLTDRHSLVISRMPVRLQGRDLGWVATLRDRTEVIGLLRELDDIRSFSEALRAQQHEFSNRLHTIAGLIELGRPDEALSYLEHVSGADRDFVETLEARIAEPVIVALLIAKATVAAERAVKVEIGADAWLDDEVQVDAGILVTILGNLIDNAVDAAASGPAPSLVMVNVHSDPQAVVIEVADSGPGIPPEAEEAMWDDGYSTKAARDGHRGLGLALVRRLVVQCHGTIAYANRSGTVFTVTLPVQRPAHSVGPALGLNQ